jgi:large subunit ribosomal protein L18e
MAMRTGSTNPQLQSLIVELKQKSSQEKVNLWNRIACDLEKPTRSKCVVNLSRLNRYTRPDEIVIVPGKVLAAGDLDHKLTVSAFSFSGSAKEKIVAAKGSCISIIEMMQKNPKGKNIRIMG